MQTNLLLFYDLMGYNYPDDKEYFKLTKELAKTNFKTQKKLSSNVAKQEKIIKKYIKLFKYIPFVEAVYVCNSVSFKSVHQNSDIDLFIISKENKLFLARFFTWLTLKLFKIRGNHQKDKFCIGFWIDTQACDLYPISIYPIDLYLAYRIAHLQPIYATNTKTKDKIYKENLWVKQIIPNYQATHKKIININPIYGESKLKLFMEKLSGWLEPLAKKLQKEKIKKNLKNKKDIIVSDYMLKFHSPDIRKVVYLRYKIIIKQGQVESDK